MPVTPIIRNFGEKTKPSLCPIDARHCSVGRQIRGCSYRRIIGFKWKFNRRIYFEELNVPFMPTISLTGPSCDVVLPYKGSYRTLNGFQFILLLLFLSSQVSIIYSNALCTN